MIELQGPVRHEVARIFQSGIDVKLFSLKITGLSEDAPFREEAIKIAQQIVDGLKKDK